MGKLPCQRKSEIKSADGIDSFGLSLLLLKLKIESVGSQIIVHTQME